MPEKNNELVQIITKFAECGWEVLDAPCKDWLAGEKSAEELIGICR